MRLIDVNALKELEPHYSEDGYRVFYEYEIDNAPTVERPIRGLAKVDTDRDIKIELLRPQGEWLPFKYNYDLPESSEYGSYVQILKDEKETHWEEYWAPEFVCSNCHAKNHKANYCPYCGAKMKGGAE